MTGRSQKAEMEAKMKKAYYLQKFRQEWKTVPIFRNWLTEDETDKNRAYCRYCKCYLISKYSDLTTHTKTKKHLKNALLYETGSAGDDAMPEKKVVHRIIQRNRSSVSPSAKSTKDNIIENEAICETKFKTEVRALKVRNSIYDNVSEDTECLVEYDVQVDDEEEEIPQIEPELIDNEEYFPTSPSISRKLQAERIKAETEYFRQRSLYFAKLAENTRIQRTLMILQSRKLHLEMQRMQNDF